MDALLFEAIGTGVGLLTSGAASRRGWKRNARKHQVRAIDAKAAAAGLYNELTATIEILRVEGATLENKLGPYDAARLHAKTTTTLNAAQAALDAYLEYVLREDVDPQAKASRGAYKAMAETLQAHLRELARQRKTLDNLHETHDEHKANIASITDAVDSVDQAITAASRALETRITEGWDVKELQDDLSAAAEALAQAERSVESREFVTASGHLATLHEQVIALINAAEELPRQRQELLRQAVEAERSGQRLARQLTIAEASLPVLREAFADTVSAGMGEEIAAARLALEHIGAMLAELQEDAAPEKNNLGDAEETAKAVKKLLKDVKTTANRITNAKTKLDELLQKVRKDAGALLANCEILLAETHQRDGNQQPVRQALSAAVEKIRTLLAEADQPKPDPDQLDTRLEHLETLIDKLGKASRRIDQSSYYDDSSESIFWAIVGGAAAVAGLDFLLG